ncbi:SDR family oxidoreductase [Salicibibacter cibi]|uniref:SDR family oxidoreductase n=1 Tax=Salicibibacter cibi TaxID=2743001 RepID=A0A7T6Z9P7_9BACI|nr:SDR family oxidoreductase [Salicibibacter cibi]QQK79287.1 SDR family oxidoreductase [Salicibibacter cibi]
MLKDQKVIITGAASGIGKETVKQCLYEGAEVIACDIDNSIYDLSQSIEHEKGLYTYQIDVSDYDGVSKFFSHIEGNHSDINGLVNNAGMYLAKNVLDYQEDEMDQVMAVNVKGAVLFSKWFGKKLMEEQRKGIIVNMSSVAGIEGSSDAIYGATKAAILGLTKSCAMNFSPYVRVNAVAPTMVNTPMMETIPDWRKGEYLSDQLIDTPVLSEDVANTVIFLLSEKSRHYTGATFDLNNGGHLR